MNQFTTRGFDDDPARSSHGYMSPPSEAEIGESHEPPGHEMTRHAPFTTLDHVLIDALVDARQGALGALSNDEIDSAVDELLQLNARRDHSCFLAGFRDALFGRQPVRKPSAENAMQVRWYWAGAVRGWARSESWDRIAEAYDGNKAVPLLGDGRDPASNIAAESIVHALRHKNRTAELQTFVKEPAVANSRQLYRLLLDIGTEMLRAGSVAEARAIFDLLMRSEGESHGIDFLPDADEWPFLQTRRRMAHCLRLLGEHLSARELLLGLLDHDPDPDIQAMVHADLGLLEGHFTLLADIRLPDDQDALPDVVDRLEKGEGHFRDAVELGVRYSAHGHYCLGILALARGSYEDADRCLDQARAHFQSRPKNYPDAILPRVDLYLGIARAQALVSEKLNHASTLIISGLGGGESFPKFLIGPTASALELDSAGFAEVADSLLHTGGDEVLDALARSEVVDSHLPLSGALYERAHRRNAGGEDAASDLRDALRGYLKTGDTETARRILDELEVLAAKGNGVEAFVALLGEPGRYEPAWQKEDAAIARARCYEAGGEYEEAFQELVRLFHRFTTRAGEGDESALDEAEGVLRTIRRYGLGPAYLEDLERRYEAVAGSLEDRDPGIPGDQFVRVLFVGGNEIQARADAAIRRRVAARDERIEITFMHSGWNSNWNVYAGEVRRHLPTHDAVVIMRYMRTHLGKHIRKMCGERELPWRSCWSSGRGGAVEAVLKAARAGRE